MASFTLAPLKYGKVVGRFVAMSGDGVDADVYPDANPVTGTVTFTPSVKKVLVATGQPDPASVELLAVTATIDSNGYLTFNNAQGVWLVATNDPSINPPDFNWTVSYNLTYSGAVVDTSKFDIKVPFANASDPTTFTDLAVVAPVPSSTGNAIVQGPPGATGPANTLTIGTVSTGTAAASITGAAPNQTLNLTLPSGGGAGTVKFVTGKSPDGTGNVALVAGDVGLGNVTNTSDANKPVSTAQAAAIAVKADDASVIHSTEQIIIYRAYVSGAWQVLGTIPTNAAVMWIGPVSVGLPPIGAPYARTGDLYSGTIG